ncbi:MAG: methionine--tRNA ligase, partial [Nocardioides sp.]|uniref:methionine--tRNA ligase n=1 Tax=Nocardioides sp. TaxID=35761 RepID=UPI003F0EE22B
MSKVLSAVAWPYANGPRHIGHVAGFGVPSDVFSRYMRMAGHDVLMVSGSDEHGTPILVASDKLGETAGEFVNRNHSIIAHELRDLGCSYDLYTRTTTGNHYEVVRELFTRCLDNGYFIVEPQQVALDPNTGRTLPDRYIEGTCPKCGYKEARGDQCDNCGNQLDPTDLIDPRSKIDGAVPQFGETDHFFLDLPAVADALRTYLEERDASGTWRPNVIKFSLNILDDIRPRAMTRDIDWGIPLPGELATTYPGKRLYVWFDAVIGYLSASIEWARRTGNPDAWREWWNDP